MAPPCPRRCGIPSEHAVSLLSKIESSHVHRGAAVAGGLSYTKPGLELPSLLHRLCSLSLCLLRVSSRHRASSSAPTVSRARLVALPQSTYYHVYAWDALSTILSIFCTSPVEISDARMTTHFPDQSRTPQQSQFLSSECKRIALLKRALARWLIYYRWLEACASTAGASLVFFWTTVRSGSQWLDCLLQGV